MNTPNIDARVAAYRAGLLRAGTAPETVNRMVVGYRNSLVREIIDARESAATEPGVPPSEPPPPTGTPDTDRRAQRLFRISEHLRQVQARIAGSDVTRMRRLLQVAKLQMDAGNLAGVHAAALELGHMTRVALLGLEGEHPVLATPRSQPPAALPPPFPDERLTH